MSIQIQFFFLPEWPEKCSSAAQLLYNMYLFGCMKAVVRLQCNGSHRFCVCLDGFGALGVCQPHQGRHHETEDDATGGVAEDDDGVATQTARPVTKLHSYKIIWFLNEEMALSLSKL